MVERRSAAFPQPPGWDAVGIAGNKLLWARNNGSISVWTLDDNLNVVATNGRQGPSGYTATSIALALQNPIACWEDDKDYYVLFDHNQGNQDAIIWLVGSNGQFRRQNSFGQLAGYRAVHFGRAADGFMKMVWARDDGHAVL